MIDKIKNVFTNNILGKETDPAAAMIKALKALNCTPKVEKTEREGHVMYFKYQGMNFRAFTFASESNKSCNIDFHAGIYPFGSLEYLRQVCNNANTSLLPVHFYFIANSKENSYNLYASTTITDVCNTPNLPELIENTIDLIFVSQKTFDETMTKKKQENDIAEEEFFMNNHEAWMLREMEMILNTKENKRNGINIREAGHSILLTDFLESVYNIPSVEIESVSITTAKQSELIKDTLRIHSLPLLEPLVANLEQPEKAQVVEKTASLSVNYIDKDTETNNVLITLHVETEEEKAIYIRISALRNGDSIGADTLWGSTRNMPKANTWLIAIDKTTESNRRAEVKYKWAEALKKAENNEEMTDEERALWHIADFPQLGDSAYWGRKLFNQKRYLEALRYFENINECLEEQFFEDFWDDALREYFAHNSYYLGICYTETGDPVRGVNYLEKASTIYSCPLHLMGFIKALFRIKDFRLIHIIRSNIEEIEEAANKLKPDESLPEARLEFYDFLQQAFALAFVLYEKYDDAIERLKLIIKNSPEPTQKWAEEKLRWVEKLKQEEQNKTPKDDDALPY